MSIIMKLLFGEASFSPEPSTKWCIDYHTQRIIVEMHGGNNEAGNRLRKMFTFSTDPVIAQNQLFGVSRIAGVNIFDGKHYYENLLTDWSTWFCSYNHIDNRVESLYAPIDGLGYKHLWKIWLPCQVLNPATLIVPDKMFVNQGASVVNYLQRILPDSKVVADTAEIEPTAILGSLADHSRLLKLARNTNLPIYDLTRLGKEWFCESIVVV